MNNQQSSGGVSGKYESPRDGMQRYVAADRDRGSEELSVENPRSSKEHARGVDGRAARREESFGPAEGDRERRHLGLQTG